MGLQHNNLKEMVHRSGVRTQYEYDAEGNLCRLKSEAGDGTTLCDLRYEYDANGNRTAKRGSMALPGEDGRVKQHLRNIRYGYDGMGRLVSEAEGDRECTYRYDLCGNRLEKESGDGRERYHYNRKNQLSGRENQSGSWSYLYDSQGNLIRETGPGRDLHYEYNARNRQTRVLSGNGCIQENLYDGEGLRAGLMEHGKRSTFVFAGGEIVAELEPGGSASRYIRGYGAAALEREGSYYGIHQDEQLSTGWITGADGKIENGYEYDSFGNLLRNSATVPNRILYGGQQYDSETGQYYLRARYYNPVVGRFLQEDPYHGDGLNLYAYCSNNPVTYYDPSGYGREHNSRAKENVKKENVTVRQGENGVEGGGADNYVYRALNQKDYERYIKGLGLEAKNPNGNWSLKEHLVNGSGKASWANDPYISTTSDLNVANGFNQSGSGYGVVKIDMNKVTSASYKGYEIYTRVNGVEGLPYHYSVWQQETSVYQSIPFEAIVDYFK